MVDRRFAFEEFWHRVVLVLYHEQDGNEIGSKLVSEAMFILAVEMLARAQVSTFFRREQPTNGGNAN